MELSLIARWKSASLIEHALSNLSSDAIVSDLSNDIKIYMKTIARVKSRAASETGYTHLSGALPKANIWQPMHWWHCRRKGEGEAIDVEA